MRAIWFQSDSGVQVNDTLDTRQKDQTHTGLLAANGQWKAGTRDELAFSGFLPYL